MGSRRLPGKVLADLGGRPLITRVLDRASQVPGVDDVVLATSDLPGDDPLAAAVRAAGWRVHRGSETDVLGRFVDAVAPTDADAVLRVTGDCPLLDPGVAGLVVARLADAADPCDLASNAIRRSYPKGLDAEALHRDVLHRLDRIGTSAESREHVTWHAYRERPELFLLGEVVDDDADFEDVNWSVDEPEDIERVRDLYDAFDLHDGRVVPWRTMLAGWS
jgi:spore coat polysaccharide biosynthesis protein SpsF